MQELSQEYKRLTAVKCWICELSRGKYVYQEGWEPNYVLFNNKKIFRVNIIATVISKYENEEKTYSNITIDDGSSTIRVKTFREDTRLLSNVNIGDLILVIGRPRENNNEIFIMPEIVRVLEDKRWQLVRKLELKSNLIDEEKIEVITQTSRQKVLNLIEKSGIEGISVSEIKSLCKLSEKETKDVVNELIREGEVFEVEGKIRIT